MTTLAAKLAFPLRHLSIRVPWHDNGWNGTVCRAPKLNSACLKLKRIANERKDDYEQAVAGRSIQELSGPFLPCCIDERAMFMAPFEYTKIANHPYAKSSPDTHGHFAPTPLRHPPYSAACIPFRWFFRVSMERMACEYGLDLDQQREPELPFETIWVQERDNHVALLNGFFGHVQPQKSLCFFYAKEVPFVEKFGRVLIGVGRVVHIGDPKEYEYQRKGPLRSMLWERMVQHSIRPGFEDGFLLPYHAAIELAKARSDFDPAEVAAMAPLV
jgi:hypothetical protein